MLTQDTLRELLHYDPDTGIFTWRIRANYRLAAGCIAGNKNPRTGYINIKIDRVLYRAHRLAWLYMTGEWPAQHMDHRNNVRHDNRWKNLREVSQAMNNQNRKTGTGVTKLLGVSPHKEGFQARISVNGKSVYLGVHDTPELAHAAYVKAKRELHPGCLI